MQPQEKQKQNIIDPLFERKVDLITEGLPMGYAKRLKIVSQASQNNALVICNYIMAMKTEINPSNNYRMINVATLTKLSKFFRNQKSFDKITRDDVLSFLGSLRKPETSDPLHKWVGTYNLNRIQLILDILNPNFFIIFSNNGTTILCNSTKRHILQSRDNFHRRTKIVM